MDFTNFIRNCLNQAATISLDYFGKIESEVKATDNNQVLTNADLAISKFLISEITTYYPKHSIIDEESKPINQASNYTWVIDPIDGTSNYVAGTPDWGIMIGLLEDHQPIAGGVILPIHKKIYLAAKGKGATCNDKIIRCSSEDKLANLLIAFGLDANHEHPHETLRETKQAAHVALACRNLRNSGSAAVDYMYVATGQYGAKIEHTAKIWDLVATHAICQEAGAQISDTSGNPIDYSIGMHNLNANYTYLVSCPQHSEKLIKILLDKSEV